MDIPGLPDDNEAEAETHEAPREKSRDSMFLQATILFDGTDKTQTVRVRNLSARGMMIYCTTSRETGLGVTVTLKNIGDVRGRVIWSTATRMGLGFDVEIDPVLARHKPEVREVPGYNRPLIGSRRPGLAIR